MTEPGDVGPSVLQVLPKLDADGSTRSVIDIARAIIEQGGTAVVASAGGSFVGEFRQAGGIHIDIPFKSKLPWQWLRMPSLISRAVVDNKIDVIHAYGRRGTRLARKAAAKTGVPFVASPIGSEEHPPENWIVDEMADAAAIIAASRFVASLVTTDMQAKMTIETVPRGVDILRFNSAAVSAERLVRLAKEWRADDLSSLILMPARLSRGKGHDVLIEAMGRMKNKDSICLIIAREDENTSYREELVRIIDEAGLAGRVRFVGQVADMPVAYMMADVVVTPSRTPEAFNGVAAEAQAMGRPVVATRVGSTTDIVLDNETGWLVPPEDPVALAEALEKALSLSDHARSIMALKARTHIERNFSLPLAQEKMLAIYRQVLERKAATA
ncbi:MAG: glycosyltransferase [Proteobacteria bacterium]|nr:glycosyltransferase [Pseudomonadota bacterium]